MAHHTAAESNTHPGSIQQTAIPSAVTDASLDPAFTAGTNLIECWEAFDHGDGPESCRGDDEAGGVPSRPA